MREQLRAKTPEEIERLAAGGRILAEALATVAAAAVPGATGRQLDRLAEERLRAAGAEPSFKGYAGGNGKKFPASLCVSVNSAIVHGVPTDEPLKDGDVVGLDLGATYQGLFTDTATTIIVGQGSENAERLLRVTEEALLAGIGAVKVGNRIGHIGATVQRVVEDAGFAVVRDLTGHGVGYAVHEAPRVPNYGRPGDGPELAEGLVLAIEPMVIAGADHRVTVGRDGWTVYARDPVLTAHMEHTVAITAAGPRILTALPA